MPETLAEYDAILTAAGYREYPKPAMISTHAAAFYQKRISDQTGVKFFINCYLYEYEKYPIGVEISAQFRGQKAAYNLMEFAKDDFDLPETESLFLALWATGNFNYSKIWGE